MRFGFVSHVTLAACFREWIALPGINLYVLVGPRTNCCACGDDHWPVCPTG